MHRVGVLFAGLALIGAGLAFGLTDHSSADYWFVNGSTCGSVFYPAEFFEGEFIGQRDCESLLDDASTRVYAALGLGALVAIAGSAWTIVGIRAAHRERVAA